MLDDTKIAASGLPAAWAGAETSRSPHTSVYLDNAATTRPAAEVIEAMRAVLETDYGNPSSRHGMGLAADKRVRRARAQVARRLGVPAKQLTFTSGGTEALALAILGSARSRRKPGHLLLSAIEHPAVMNTARLVEREGHHVEIVPVQPGGWIAPAAIAERLRPETFLVAVMHVNNETGVVQPIEQIGALLAQTNRQCRLLVDAVQSFGVLDTDLSRLGADLVAVSAHKLHGPKGVGALATAAGVQLAPLWGGGNQEGGLRSGTENVPGIVGFGVAAELGKCTAWPLAGLLDALASRLLAGVPGAYLLGDLERRAPHIVAVGLPGRRSDVLVNALAQRGIFISSGSACHSRGTRRSHVLRALGVPETDGVIRLSPSRFTDEAQVERAAELILQILQAG